MAESAMGICLLDLPYEIVFEIFRRLPKSKLVETSKLSVKLRDIAGDARFWKNVCIKYEPNTGPENGIFAFEELYSESWPVKAIDLSNTKIKSPLSLRTDQLVKVTKLHLSSVKAYRGTIEAILAKYQCTELYLDFELTNCYGHVQRVSPAAFSKQTALEVLSLRTQKSAGYDTMQTMAPTSPYHHWLALVLSYCKNLKSLELSRMDLNNFGLESFVKFLPTSLEKLLLLQLLPPCPGEHFLELLAESCPNLRELELCPSSVKFSSLLEFQFLETLRIFPCHCQGTDVFLGDLYMYLLKFPALKAVCIIKYTFELEFEESNVERLRSMLETHGVIVELINDFRWPTLPVNDNIDDLWEVSKTV